MNYVFVLLLAYPAYWVAQCLYGMYRGVRIAQRSGIPYILSPILPENIFWLVLSPMLKDRIEQYFPTFYHSRLGMSIYGWEQRYRNSLNEKYGSVFFIVNFHRPELIVADPDVAHEVLKRPKDFPNSPAGDFIMGKFGPNLLTTGGPEWARQRKVIASNINEKISAAVWAESLTQAEQMMDHIAANGGATNDSAAGMKSVAINVLGAAGYGQPRAWKDDKAAATAPPGFHVTYMQAMRLICENLIEMAFLSPKVLLLPFWPKHINDTGHAVNELKGLTQDLLDKERQQPSEKANILKLLIAEENGAEKAGTGLHNNEIIGNLFVFSAAGFDTTANTMAYALVLLALYPKWQDWIIEELDQALPEDRTAELDYNEYYPKLTRVQAVMWETLRTFPPIVHLAKMGGDQPVPLTTSTGKQITIAPRTLIYINPYALASDPKVWEDPLLFTPSRWIGHSETDGGKVGKAFIKPAPKGSFLAWSTGPRACPGQKMSQVEFVSVFTQILRGHKIEVVKKVGESDEEARGRAREVMDNSAAKVTVAMLRPKDLELRFVKRH